jgi:predicted lysophospholipase L1 biosynthesis ABC-type transport system permease subunit
LKTLGFTQRQLALSVAWQSSVVAVVSVALGIPLGVAVGRELWILFARTLDTVPSPTVPALTLTLVGVGALVFANLVAAIPERVASRTPAALVLRAD